MSPRQSPLFWQLENPAKSAWYGRQWRALPGRVPEGQILGLKLLGSAAPQQSHQIIIHYRETNISSTSIRSAERAIKLLLVKENTQHEEFKLRPLNFAKVFKSFLAFENCFENCMV